jgi:hypothetical protein
MYATFIDCAKVDDLATKTMSSQLFEVGNRVKIDGLVVWNEAKQEEVLSKFDGREGQVYSVGHATMRVLIDGNKGRLVEVSKYNLKEIGPEPLTTGDRVQLGSWDKHRQEEGLPPDFDGGQFGDGVVQAHPPSWHCEEVLIEGVWEVNGTPVNRLRVPRRHVRKIGAESKGINQDLNNSTAPDHAVPPVIPRATKPNTNGKHKRRPAPCIFDSDSETDEDEPPRKRLYKRKTKRKTMRGKSTAAAAEEGAGGGHEDYITNQFRPRHRN